MERLIRQIRVRNEQGDDLTVLEFQDFREFGTVQGPRKIPGRVRFMLQNGEAVNEADNEQFVLASTGEALSRSG